MTERVDVTADLMVSLEEAAAIVRGDAQPSRFWKPPASVDVKAIRARRGMSQVAFARHYGFSADAVRDWEQGRRRPAQAARTLLMIIDREPEAVERVLLSA